MNVAKGGELVRFVLTLRALDVIELPPYKGSTFRGGFGTAFKKVVCTIKGTECDNCLLKSKCIYSYIFETPPPEDYEILRKYENAPHPFIIIAIESKKNKQEVILKWIKKFKLQTVYTH